MKIKLKDLLKIGIASQKYKTDYRQIFLEALDDKISLFLVSPKDMREVLIPCKDGELHHADVGEFIHQYQPLLDHKIYVDVELGQPLKLNARAIKSLIVHGQFSEAELYRQLAPSLNTSAVDFWKTEREVYDWKKKLPEHTTFSTSDIYVVESELVATIESNKQSSSTSSTQEKPPTTALKVIGLLMHHLSKSPKYASGSSPNKVQIKELLLELATELSVNTYGLNKVDERLLTEAMRYLETQKN